MLVCWFVSITRICYLLSASVDSSPVIPEVLFPRRWQVTSTFRKRAEFLCFQHPVLSISLPTWSFSPFHSLFRFLLMQNSWDYLQSSWRWRKWHKYAWWRNIRRSGTLISVSATSSLRWIGSKSFYSLHRLNHFQFWVSSWIHDIMNSTYLWQLYFNTQIFLCLTLELLKAGSFDLPNIF